MTQQMKKSGFFDQNDLIGQGAFSKVYKSNKFTQGSTETTAVKVYQKSKANQDVIDHAKRQTNILKNVDSEYICSYRQSLESKNKFYMVQKLEEGITLDNILKQHKRLDPKEVIKVAKAILKGLEYLHLKGIMHRDLKPANIMYNSGKAKAVILDLGFATYFHKKDEKVLTHIVGTPNYMSPQILMGKKYNSLSDVWSFGVILYQLLCGQLPFKGRSQKQILNSILVKDLKFRQSNSPTLQWLILNCLKIDANERITWEALFQWMNTGQLKVRSARKKGDRQKLDSSRRNSLSPGISLQRQQNEGFCDCNIF